jgi:hypothetical protein
VSSQGWLRLPLPPEEPGQARRLAAFRAAHPDVIIGSGGFGTWQARIPTETGETVTTRYTLRELLDRLDELTALRGSEPARDLPIRTAPLPASRRPAVPWCGGPSPARSVRRAAESAEQPPLLPSR